MNDNLNNPTNLDYTPLASQVEVVQAQTQEVDYTTKTHKELQGVELSLTDTQGKVHKFTFDSKRLKFGAQQLLKAKNSRGIKFNLKENDALIDGEAMQITNYEISLELILILFAIPKEFGIENCDAEEVRPFLDIIKVADPLRLGVAKAT